MKFYTKEHKHNCGIDLHSREMYVCIVDKSGKKVLHQNIKNSEKFFLKIVNKYREDLAVAVESTFNWYWLADMCLREGITFILGHALYMRAINGAKVKNDRVDSEKIARLLRAGMIPQAYVYPIEMRAVRDLLRRRLGFVRTRAGLLGHIQLTNLQYNLPSIGKAAHYKGKRAKLPEHFDECSVKRTVEADIQLIEDYNKEIRKLEKYILGKAKIHCPEEIEILQSIPGVGKILSLTFMYEINTIDRFPRVQDFSSYTRAVKSAKESAGKKYGYSGAKMGNPYLKWALSEAAVLSTVHNPTMKDYYHKLEQKHSKGKAKAIMRAKLARTIFYMLKRKELFDVIKFKSKQGKEKHADFGLDAKASQFG